MLRVVTQHDVRFVVIGGYAAILHGSSVFTNDADVCPDDDPGSLERLCAALLELDARIRTASEPEDVPFSCSAAFLAQMKMLNLTTRVGDFDLSFAPAAFSRGYADLITDSVEYDLGGFTVSVASLHDIIASKEMANRDKDRAVLPVLKALQDEIADRERDGR